MPTEKSKIVYVLLAWFLGSLGAHKFYLGQMKEGIILLVATCTIIGAFITPWVGAVEAVMTYMKSDEQFAADVAANKPWAWVK